MININSAHSMAITIYPYNGRNPTSVTSFTELLLDEFKDTSLPIFTTHRLPESCCNLLLFPFDAQDMIELSSLYME